MGKDIDGQLDRTIDRVERLTTPASRRCWAAFSKVPQCSSGIGPTVWIRDQVARKHCFVWPVVRGRQFRPTESGIYAARFVARRT
jgi:hypothetical protein